jgi:hypothetical protein
VFIAFIVGAVSTSPLIVLIAAPQTFASISAARFGSRFTSDRCNRPSASRDAEALNAGKLASPSLYSGALKSTGIIVAP